MGLGEGALDEADDPGAVVEGGVFGEEAGARGRDVGVSQVGEDVDGSGGGGVVLDYAYAELVGGAFEAEGDGHGQDGSGRRGERRAVVMLLAHREAVTVVDLKQFCDGINLKLLTRDTYQMLGRAGIEDRRD